MAYTINRHLANLLTSTGSLATGKIPADYITNAHIADNTIATSQLHSSFTIGSGHIPANTVTISHLAVTDGSAGQVLKTDGSGNLSFTTISADKITEGNTFVEAIDTGSNGQILFVTENTQRWQISSAGHLLPIAHNSFDIGSATHKVRDLYVDDNSIHIGSDTKLSVDAAGEFNITDNAGTPKKIKVDEIEIGTGDDRVILKKGASGDIEQQRKLSGVKQTATKPFLIGVHNSGDITEGGSNKFYTDARVQAYLTGQGIVNQSAVIAAITDSAPSTLDTLNELAAAIGDDENFSTTITNSIATKAPKASPIFTGTVTGVTGSFSGSLALSADSSQLQLGTGNRAQIFHNSAALYLRSSTGGVIVQGPTLNHYSSDATTLYFSSASGGLSFGGTNFLNSSRKLQNVTLGEGTTGARFQANAWHYDNSGLARFYFEGSGRTFLRSETGFQFRANGDTTRFNISPAGHIHIASGGDSQASSTEYIKAGGVAVLTSSRVLQNVSGNVSMFTNDAGYTTNVGDVTAVGAVGGTPISVADGGGPVPKIGWYTTLINTSTNNADGDYFLVHNGTANSGSSHKLLKANINISGFNNDAGYTSFDGDYNSLSNRPTIPTNNNQLTNGASYITSSALSPYLTSSTAASTYATPADITAAVNGLVDGAPGALNTLDELAAALGDDQNFATTITNSIGGKLSVTGGTLTGKLIISNANYNNHLELTRTGQGTIGLTPSGNQILVEGGTGFSPSSSNGQDLGRSDKYWRDIYFGNSIKANGTTVIDSNRNTTFNNSNAISFLSTNGYWVGGTRRIDGSGNLENIGTISSGTITSTGAMQLYVGSDAVTTDNTGLTFTLTGTYSDGRYEHRFRKRDEGGGIPLYIDRTESTANSHTAIARFGSYTSNPDQFEVYGGMRAASGAIIGKLAVKSSAVHGSYDFYNNGTSYFNGSVIIDDALDITGTNRALKIAGTTRINSVGDFIGTSYYVGGTNVINTSGNWVGGGNISQFTNNSGYITSADGGNAATLDSLDSTKFTYYRGVVSGDWDTIFTTGTGKTQTSGLYQINNTASGHSNFPVASGAMLAPYSYGGVFAWQLANHTFKLYSPHVGNLYYQSGWSNDEYSGWRMIIDSGNYQSAGLWASHNDGAGSGLDADTLDGQQGSYYAIAGDSQVFQRRGSLNINDTSDGSQHNPFDDAHVETRVAENGTRSVSYTGASAHLFTSFTGGSASVLQIGAHYNGSDFYMRTRTDGSTWQTWKKLWHTGNDGSGSGLDADLLDGQQGSYYLDYNNLSNKPTISGVNTGTNNVFTVTQYFRKNNVTNYTNAQLITESYGGASTTAGIGFHISGSIGRYLSMNNTGVLRWEGSTIWDSGNDGSGSGLDADTLDGQHASAFQAAGSYLTGNQTITLSGPVTGSGTTSISTSNPYQTSVVFSTNGPDSVMEYQQQASITDTKLAPTGDWHNSIRMGHGDPYSYYSNTIALQMTGSLTGTLRTQTISNNNAQGWRTVWDTGNDGAGSGLDADLLDGQHGSYYAPITDLSNYVHKNANTMTGTSFKMGFHSGGGGTTFGANHYSMGVDIANGGWSGTNYSDLIIGYHTGIRIGAGYSGIRFYDNSPTTDTNNSGNGDGAEELLMTIGGGGSSSSGSNVTVHNNLIVGGTVDGRDVAADGTKLDTIATNANYITNNNQLTNGAGYTTNTGTLTATNDRIYISDTRNANRDPSYYDDRYVQADFNQSVYFGVSGGDAWATTLTVSKWNSWNAAHRQEQLIFAGTKRAFRVATSDSAWSSAYTIWDSSTDGSGSGLDADTVDGINGASFLRSDANDQATGSIGLRGGGQHLGNHEFAASSTSTAYSVAAVELRESNYTANGSATPPNLGFHWGGVVASNISMDSAGAITIRNNPGTAYENLRANNIYAQGTNLVWHTGNDGPGTGLDADTVDGQHASAFLTDGSIYLRSNTGDTIDNNVVITQRGEFTTGTSGQNNSRQAGTLSYSYGYQFGGAWSNPFPDLVMGYHTGMRFGGYHGYGGCRFYNDHPSRTTTMLFSVGNGDAHVRANNNIYAYTSDKRLKENFRPIENAVDKVKAIGGFIFDWRKDMMDKHEFTPDQEKDDAGLIAQEVQKVLPAAIRRAPFDHDLTKPNQSKSGEEFLTVQYEKVVPLLVEAIKEQQKQIDELKKLLENK